MVQSKFLFDMAGVAALAYMTCGPAAQIVMAREQPVRALTAVATQPGLDVAEPVQITRAEDGLFYVWCEVNGTPVRFLVDTGASVVVLTPEDARRAGVAIERSRSARLETASGASHMRWARLDRVTLAGQELRGLDAAVVAGRGGLRVSLLGQNLLTKMNAVAIDGNHMHLR